MDSRHIIGRLGMAPHPEGGWYVETFRDQAAAGGRGACTAIYFLLEAGQRSHGHRVDATEIWLWHAGGPLQLQIADGERRESAILGAALESGQRPQAVVPAGAWQSAAPLGDWVLVSCIVAPAFSFEGFDLAAPDWQPG